jgi:iron complex outermembrane receptor protein
VSLTSEIKFSKQLKWTSQLVYTRGKDFNNVNLPFMSPLNYSTSLAFAKDNFSTEIMLQGNTKQINFSEVYGEDETPDYAIANVNFGYKIQFGKNRIIVKTGLENILDTYYSTYSDWNNFPRMGRNIFLNLSLCL